MTGTGYVIEKLGQALAAAEQENAALRQEIARLTTEQENAVPEPVRSPYGG